MRQMTYVAHDKQMFIRQSTKKNCFVQVKMFLLESYVVVEFDCLLLGLKDVPDDLVTIKEWEVAEPGERKVLVVHWLDDLLFVVGESD